MRSVGIIFIGTGKYHIFFDDFYHSINKYFLTDCKKTFFVFTNKDNIHRFKNKNVVLREIENREWPFPTLMRFKYIIENKNVFDQTNYLFYIDADLHAVNKIESKEIFVEGKPYIAIQHPGYYDNPYSGDFEKNELSYASVANDKECDLSQYLCGGFWGSDTKRILKMCDNLSLNVDIDLSKNIIAKWHDESHVNKYFSKIRNKINSLHPGYCYPETHKEHDLYEFYSDIQEKIKKLYPIKMTHLYKKRNLIHKRRFTKDSTPL